MKATTKKTTTILLELNEEEAKWLKGRIQNFCPETPNDVESSYDGGMRKRLWEALKEIPV